MSYKYSWTYSGVTDLISALFACLLYCNTRDFFCTMGMFLPGQTLFLVAVMVDISFWDDMLIFHPFSTCCWLVAGRGVLLIPLSQVRKCLISSVA